MSDAADDLAWRLATGADRGTESVAALIRAYGDARAEDMRRAAENVIIEYALGEQYRRRIRAAIRALPLTKEKADG